MPGQAFIEVPSRLAGGSRGADTDEPGQSSFGPVLSRSFALRGCVVVGFATDATHAQHLARHVFSRLGSEQFVVWLKPCYPGDSIDKTPEECLALLQPGTSWILFK